MLFCTYKFIFLFFPIVILGYYLLLKLKRYELSKLWLVVASLYFYAQGSIDFFPFFVGSILLNYFFGTALSKDKVPAAIKKAVFILIVLANVALLGYYKYMDFFIDNANLLFKTEYAHWNLALPIGISFFTFQQIAFLVDSYRGETKEYNLLNYMLFVTFFPQLIVGPIVHHKEMIPQFEDKNNQRVIWDNIAKGIFIFSIGCAKKLLIADPLTSDAQLFFSNITDRLVFTEAWYHSIEYTISYYFDLSGYADMAIGLGWMFNIRISENFNSPYKASNFQEYWKRWHMTLSRFLSNYIFRSVYKKGSKYRNYYVATMVTFFVSGFWHGAGWTFVLWGVINGAFVCIAAYRKRHDKHMPLALAYVLTAIGVVGTRVLFVSSTFAEAWFVYKGMFNIAPVLGTSILSAASYVWEFLCSEGSTVFVLLLGMGICWFAPNTSEIMAHHKNNKKTLAYALALMFLCIINMAKVVQFLYFQF